MSPRRPAENLKPNSGPRRPDSTQDGTVDEGRRHFLKLALLTGAVVGSSGCETACNYAEGKLDKWSKRKYKKPKNPSELDLYEDCMGEEARKQVENKLKKSGDRCEAYAETWRREKDDPGLRDENIRKDGETICNADQSHYTKALADVGLKRKITPPGDEKGIRSKCRDAFIAIRDKLRRIKSSKREFKY